MENDEDINELQREANIILTPKFRKTIRNILIKEGILKENVNLCEVDGYLKDYFDDEIKRIEKKIKEPDPLDEIFLTKRETKLKKQLEEQKSINEHLRQIYKRDLKRKPKTQK